MSHQPDLSDGYRFPVEAGAIVAFARAVGDRTREWTEDLAVDPGPLTASPTFVASCVQFDPDWRYRPHPERLWHGSSSGPGSPPPQAGTGKRLHAEQHYEYHVPVKAGDVLTVRTKPGRRWEKQSRDGRILLFDEEITFFTNQRGELAVTARCVGVVTEG